MRKSNAIEAIYPLSPIQQGMLFHSLYEPDSSIYFEQLVFALRGDLNSAALQRAWQHVVERHPILRTIFVWEGREKPLQVVRRQIGLAWEEIDWRTAPPADHAARLAAFLRADRERGFAFAKAPPMRLFLIRL